MVRLVYNIGQNVLILLFWPLILLFVLLKAKYRSRFWLRCGFGLRRLCQKTQGGGRRFWIHALSVGEVSSVVSLVKALRKTYPDAILILSTSTTAGGLYAKTRLVDTVDTFVDFPYDHILIVRYFITMIRPDLFVQVETDFWPNLLAEMKNGGIPSLLVNGRVSQASFFRYQKYPALFFPLFNSFTCLAMQTAADMKRMENLGVAAHKVEMPGNLKIDAAMSCDLAHRENGPLGLPGKRVVVFGSTHPGEDEVLAPVLAAVKKAFPDVYFVVAPRDINRGREVAGIMADHGVTSCCRSQCAAIGADIDCLVLDTMGELVSYYQHADIAFVGGSLKPFGGHNPLEPAAFGTPVFFGPHMEDFEDICAEMLAGQSAVQVTDGEMLAREIAALLKSKERCKELGQAGLDYIIKRQGVTKRHLDIIDRLLGATHERLP